MDASHLFRCVFALSLSGYLVDAAGLRENMLVVVRTNKAPLMSGSQLVDVANKGDVLKIIGVSGDWVQVRFDTPRVGSRGWLESQHVQALNLRDESAISLLGQTRGRPRDTSTNDVRLPSTRAPGGEWSQWRGPDRNGGIKNSAPLISSLSDETMRVVWRNHSVPSEGMGGYGSVTISNGRAFVYACSKVRGGNDAAQDEIYCLAADSGRTIWKKSFNGWGNQHPSSSTPCVADGRVYVHGSGGNAYCLDATNGETVWKTNTRGNTRGNDSSSFAVADGVAVLTAGPPTAWDARTGEDLWRADGVRGTHNSPTIWRQGGKTYVLCNTQNQLVCLDLRTGRVRWAVRGGGDSSAVIDGDIMVIGSSNTGLVAYRISESGAEQLWRNAYSGNGSTPAIYNGHVYAVGGNQAMCVDMATGQVKWGRGMGGAVHSSPIVVDDKVIAVTGNNLRMFSANPTAFENLGMGRINTANCSSPAVVDGKLFLRMREGVACFDVRR